MKKLIFLLILIAAGAQVSNAVPAVSFELEVAQQDSLTNSTLPVYIDTVTAVTGMELSGFVGPMTVDILLAKTDSVRAHFSVYAVTLGPLAYTVAKQYAVEYSLPAIIRDIKCKNDTKYQLKLTPLEELDVDTSFCGMSHSKEKSFFSNPTAYTDIYYVQHSFGDYYWEAVKDLIENSYRQFKDFAKFNLPGKYAIFLYPCKSYSVIWDKRFGMGFDPSRNNSYSIYTKEVSTVDPYLITHAAVLNNFGYAPPFLAEGFSNYYAFTIYDMRQILKNQTVPPLDSMLNSYAYLHLEPFLADRVSSTFAKYLINSYGLGQFIRLYKASDDINLESKLQVTYNKSIAELQEEWLTYVDTLTLTARDFGKHLYNAEMMQRHDEMLKYSKIILDYAANKQDSLESLDYLKRAYFFNGDYYKAIEVEERLLKIDSSKPVGFMALGSYNMMVGNYEKAGELYDKAQKMDTANQMIRFNRGLLALHNSDTTTAKRLFLANLSNQKGALAQSETRVLLGQILSQSKDSTDREQAKNYFAEAASSYQQSLQVNNASSNLYLWIGMASIGLQEYKAAIDYLELGSFLESRPFFLSMINLWLGKAYLADNQPEQAKAHFAEVLALSGAAYHQEEARKALDKL